MSAIIWTRPALADADRLFQFLKEKNPQAARNAAQKIKRAADALAANPELGKPMPDDTGRRELMAPFGKRGYVLRYRIDDAGRAVILRVWHYREER